MKIKLFLKVIAGLFLLMLAFTVTIFCMYFYTRGGSRVVKLPGDYQLIRSYSNNIAVSRQSNDIQVIASPVDGYAVCGYIVVGHVGEPGAGETSDFGYFIIDTRQQVVHKRLEKKAYLRLLYNYGITSAPALKSMHIL